jgi:hypothetical protein
MSDIVSKPSTPEYELTWDRIFGKITKIESDNKCQSLTSTHQS